MIVTQESKPVTRSGSFEEWEFRVEASAFTFEILSTLYSDGIMACIRETLANCWDSHKRASIESRPFIVYIPNKLNPNFYARDYGKGLNTKEKNVNWRGGVSRGYKTGYYSRDNTFWRKTVFDWYDYTCQN